MKIQVTGKHLRNRFDFLKLLLLVFSCSFSTEYFAQNNRIHTKSDIGWYNFFGTFNLNPKIGIHLEYQWRRDEYITNWQQSLLRTGINYRINPRILCRAGYAWIETYNYGEIPLNGFGRDFTEHRIFEMLQLSQKEGRFDIGHRFISEQRFIGKYLSAGSEKEEEFPLVNRMRYMFRLQTPLKGKVMTEKTPYLVFYDEVMIGFGKNVNANVFDQNRICALIGYLHSVNLAFEIGYMNQLLQFGRLIDGRNVFQQNAGIVFNIMLRGGQITS